MVVGEDLVFLISLLTHCMVIVLGALPIVLHALLFVAE